MEGITMRISDYFQIGDRLKTIRKNKGHSQRAMANDLGLSFSTYSNYENGYSEPPMEIIEKFCGLVGITIADLFEMQLSGNNLATIKTFSELISILIDLDRRGLPIKSSTTYSQADNQLTAHLTLDIANAQLATFIPDWNKINEEYRSGLMDDDEYKAWLKDTLSIFNVPIDDYI